MSNWFHCHHSLSTQTKPSLIFQVNKWLCSPTNKGVSFSIEKISSYNTRIHEMAADLKAEIIMAIKLTQSLFLMTILFKIWAWDLLTSKIKKIWKAEAHWEKYQQVKQLEKTYTQQPDKVTTEHRVTLLPGLGYLKVLEPSFAQVTPFTHMLQQCKWILVDLHNFASERDSRLQKGWRKSTF